MEGSSNKLEPLKKYVTALRIYRIWILGALTCGALIAGIYGKIAGQQKYTAEFIIAAEQEKSSGWENLLAQFGMDVGGSNPGGVFVGESLVKLFSVRSSIEEALLLPYTQIGQKKILLADIFFSDLNKSTRRNLKNVEFHSNLKENNSATDSALWFLYEHINKNVLSASKPDKKQTFITVNCKHANDTLALRFAEAMIEVVTEKYIRSITRNVRRSLLVLRKEADSIQWVMNKNIARNASNMDYNINPLQQSAKIEQNKSLIDMQISISLYGEIVKNLKLAELALKKQTPLIEIVDVPHFPLNKTGWPLWQFIFVGALAGLGLSLGILHFMGKFD
jgi:hypothetical protein